MRTILVFLAIVTFSFALASSIMLIYSADAPEVQLPIIAPLAGTSSAAVQGYATIEIVAPEDVSDVVFDNS